MRGATITAMTTREQQDIYYSGERYGVVRTVDDAYVVVDRQTGSREVSPLGRNAAHRIARRRNREHRATA